MKLPIVMRTDSPAATVLSAFFALVGFAFFGLTDCKNSQKRNVECYERSFNYQHCLEKPGTTPEQCADISLRLEAP